MKARRKIKQHNVRENEATEEIKDTVAREKCFKTAMFIQRIERSSVIFAKIRQKMAQLEKTANANILEPATSPYFCLGTPSCQIKKC